MGAQEWALALLGIGFLSSRLEAGTGLGALGAGVQKLIAAPLTGTGAGLSAFGRGITDIITPFGDIGRGITNFLNSLPAWLIPTGLPWTTGVSGNGNGPLPAPAPSGGPPLIAMSGDGAASLYTGGGANVPTGASFSFVEPSAFIRSAYAVTPGYHAGLGVSGWWVANTPNQDAPAGGGTMI